MDKKYREISGKKYEKDEEYDIYEDEEAQGVSRGGSWGDRGGWRGGRGAIGLPRGAGETFA